MLDPLKNYISSLTKQNKNKIIEIIFMVLLGLGFLAIWFAYWNPIIQGKKTIAEPHRSEIIREFKISPVLGREYPSDEGKIFKNTEKPETWHWATKLLSQAEKTYQIHLIRWVEWSLLFLSAFAGIFGFIAGKKYFQNPFSGYVLAIFFSLGPLFLNAATKNIPLIYFVSFFPLLIYFWIKFYETQRFFWTLLLGFFVGIGLNFTASSEGLIFLLGAFLLSLPKLFEHIKKTSVWKKNFFRAIAGNILVVLFAFGFSGSFGVRLIEEGFSDLFHEGGLYFSWNDIKSFVEPNFYGIFGANFKPDLALFPLDFAYLFIGYGLLTLAAFGLLFGHKRNIYLMAVSVLFFGLSMNFEATRIFDIQIGSIDFLLIFFIALFFLGAGGMAFFYQKRLYRKVAGVLLLLIILIEPLYAIYGQEYFFTYSVQNNQRALRLINHVKEELKSNKGWNMVDDQQLLSPALWAQYGIVNQPLPDLAADNPDILDLLGTRIIFSEVIKKPNPMHFKKQNINGEMALVNQKALPEMAFIPHQKIQTSSPQKINFRLINRAIDFQKEAYINETVNSDPLPPLNTPPKIQETTLKTVFRNQNSWLINANVNTNGILIFSHKFTSHWKILVNKNSTDALKVNEMIMGIPLAAGEHNIEIYNKNDRIKNGAEIMKKTAIFAGLLLILEILFIMYRKKMMHAPHSPEKKKK